MSPQTNTKPAPEVIGDYTVHPVASMFPLLEGKDYEELKQSIKEHGQLEPIIVDDAWAADPLLLDGRNRLRACLELKIDPWITTYETQFKKQVPPPAEEFILAENLWRRHLTDEQRGAVVTKATRWREAEVAKARKKSGKSADGSAGGRGRKKNLNQESGSGFPKRDVAEMHANSTVGRIAATAKISRYAAEQQVAVSTHAPELADQVAAGTMPLKDAAAEAHTRKAEKIGAKVPPPPKPAAPPAPVDQNKLIVADTAEILKHYMACTTSRQEDEFKRGVYKKLEELWGPPEDDSPRDRRSRPQRWQDAVEELKALQQEYEDWRDKNTEPGAVMAKLLEVTTLDLSILNIDLPLGWGRD